MVNYKWRKAFSVLGIKFSSEDRARENFPELIAFGRIARLQHPTDLRAERTLANAMLDDCKRGDLEHVVKVLPPKAVMNGKIHFVREWGGTQLEAAHTPSPQPKDVTEYQIAAPAFAAWLAALPDKDKTPSEHIAAWFEAVGVNTQDEAAPVPTASPATVTTQTTKHRDLLAPLVEAAQKACDSATDAAAVFTKLKTWAQEDKPRAPLVGVTEDGRIQWRDSNDTPQELSIKALKSRLKRQEKPPATTPPGKQLRRIK